MKWRAALELIVGAVAVDLKGRSVRGTRCGRGVSSGVGVGETLC
ncbi:hypothetical protein [Nocardia sp. NPDC049526]